MADTGFGQVLAHLRSISDGDGSTKGKLFEHLVKSFLKTDQIYTDRFQKVWLWAEYPNRNGRSDFGIDLVAQEQDGSLCAIQCKFFNDQTLTKKNIDSFLEAGSRSSEFKHMMLVYVAKGYGKKVEAALKAHNCQTLGFESLSSSNIDWPDLAAGLTAVKKRKPYDLRSYQKEAIKSVTTKMQDRGQMIMACGTGKTLTSLRLAEQMVGKGGLVLYAVPSISLMRQTIRYWAEQRTMPHSYIGVCSDPKVSHNETIDIPLREMEIGVTTNIDNIAPKLFPRSNKLTVVFSTYQSMDAVIDAQQRTGVSFDLVLCDEAHRTTGVEREDSPSSFLNVHDQIKADKRLYMTATPRMYKGSVKKKASTLGMPIYSMDDESRFGPELYTLNFSDAIDKELLSDYKVVVLGVDESYAQRVLQGLFDATTDSGGLNLSDAARMLGLCRVLQEPEREIDKTLQTAIVYTNRVSSSKTLAKQIEDLAKSAKYEFACSAKHVDGTQNATERANALQWLRDVDDGCRILSNARCLSEGVDVPSLDAIAFMNPKHSQVDIIQAVGRVMRKATDKRYGYVIIPIGIPSGSSAESILDNNDVFGIIWEVLRALRSHDPGLDIEANTADLRRTLPKKMQIYGIDSDGNLRESSSDEMYPLGNLDVPADALYSKIVEKVGDRLYMERWANDVARVVDRLQTRIADVIANNSEAATKFDNFMKGLRDVINNSVTKSDGIDMLSQHMITHRIFNALFGEEFKNPISAVLEDVVSHLRKHGLDAELRDIELFYKSIESRVSGLEDRQPVISELYGSFFKKAFPKMADRLGIVYTPVEVIDFILRSVDYVLRDNFDRGITNENVNIIDPFTGAGTFLTRLIQSDLIKDGDIVRKYRDELFASEIVLLAYYIAAVNCESAYQNRTNMFDEFTNLSLTDTFNLTDITDWTGDVMAKSKIRIRKQRDASIMGAVSNPPYSAGQKLANEDNQNVSNPMLEKRIKDTYIKRAPKGNKMQLYNSYLKALRWASDKIGKSGVIGFIMPSAWITGNAEAGVRACIYEEFTDVYCFDLRGDVKKANWRKEGGKIFDSGSTVGTAIVILVKNLTKTGCTIHYHDIGDYLTREEKLNKVKSLKDVSHVQWRIITPDRYHDWLDQRGVLADDWDCITPMGSKDGKRGKTSSVIFETYSLGLATHRDTWVYNTSVAELTKNMNRHIDYCNSQDPDNFKIDIKSASWNIELSNALKKLSKPPKLDKSNIRTTLYRPFFKQNLYFDPTFIAAKYQIPSFYPKDDTKNPTILVPDKIKGEFSTIITDTTPDLHVHEASQAFPFKTKIKIDKKQSLVAKLQTPNSKLQTPNSKLQTPKIWR